MQTRASHTGDLQVSEHRSSLGQWRVAQRRADPRLRDYVHGFVVSEGYLPSAVHEWHIPSLEVAVVLNFAAPHRIVDISDLARTTDYHSGWMAGLQSRHRLTEAVGARDFIVIRFTPIGAHLFLMTPMDLLTDRTIALEEIDRPFTRRFANRVEAARNWDSRLELIEHLVAERIALARPPSLILIDSWRKLMNAPNTIDLPLLASESGCSRRHLIAQFHTHFGMAPKMIARIRRFNQPSPSWIDSGETQYAMQSGRYLDREQMPNIPPKWTHHGPTLPSSAATTISLISLRSSALLRESLPPASCAVCSTVA